MVQTESRWARWSGILRFARRQLQQRWLESVFILLGIAMGVGVFTAMETFLTGLSVPQGRFTPQLHAVRVQVRTFDASAFYEHNTPAIRLDASLAAPILFSTEDVLTLRESLPTVGNLFVSSGTRGIPLRAIDGESVGAGFDPALGGQPLQVMVRPTSPDEFYAAGREFLAGSSFTWEDVANRNPHIVLDDRAARILFPNQPVEDAVGRTLTTALGPGAAGSGTGTVWTVIGVVAAEEDPFFLTDAAVVQTYSPLGIMDDETYRELYVLPAEGITTSELIRQLQAYFDQLHGEGRIVVREPSAATSGTGFVVALLGLSSLALLIAAVNILNLFTARVLRRQRYTGMSLALGATRSIIFWQTTGEALLIGVSGSLLGLLIAAGLLRLLVAFLAAGLGQTGEFNPLSSLGLTWADGIVGIGVGTGISLLFGLYPGWLAARQEPAEALRIE